MTTRILMLLVVFLAIITVGSMIVYRCSWVGGLFAIFILGVALWKDVVKSDHHKIRSS